MDVGYWSFFIGLLLITMVLVSSELARLPLSSAMIYLAVGCLLGPAGLAVIALDPIRDAGLLKPFAEIALLIALFTVGLKMGMTRFGRRWLLPVRLAFISMALTVGLIALVACFLLDMSLGAAVLLGAILAPTDPVLAADVQLKPAVYPDRLRFSLAGEGGLNDGTAFPFVMLGLGLLNLHDLGTGGWRWWALDLIWATVAGLAIGAALGAVIGWLIVRMRTRHQSAVGMDEFLCLGLIGLAYGAAQLSLASGFLAVFAAGVAWQRVKEQPQAGTRSLDSAPETRKASRASRSTHSHHASSSMSLRVLNFNEQLEKVAELAVVLALGAMLGYALVVPMAELMLHGAFILILFLILRPVATIVGTLGEPFRPGQRGMVAWFGIRGIGSVYYLFFAIHQGVQSQLAQQLVTLTLLAVAASIVVHGLTAQPLMKKYLRL
jgi:sodium/hydrogen antiporter